MADVGQAYEAMDQTFIQHCCDALHKDAARQRRSPAIAVERSSRFSAQWASRLDQRSRSHVFLHAPQ